MHCRCSVVFVHDHTFFDAITKDYTELTDIMVVIYYNTNVRIFSCRRNESVGRRPPEAGLQLKQHLQPHAGVVPVQLVY